jgi:hypothetical protein
MRNLNWITLFLVAPSLAVAQTSASGNAETKTHADVSAGRTHASAQAEASAAVTATADRPQPKPDSTQHRTGDRVRALHGLSAENRAQAEATFQRARRDSVPEHPVVSAMLEAQAKGATETQILNAQQWTLVRLETSKEAMVRGGRSHPSEEEVHRGANVLARGVTKAQLEGVVRRCPSDRSLTVAFETLTELTASGIPASTAVAEVGAQLQARASDDAIHSLTTTLAANAATSARVNPTGVDAGAGAATSAGATVGRTVGGASATGGLTGTISGGLSR